MTEVEVMKRYRESAVRNLDTARDLLKGKHFDWALFLGQLCLEKLLKALIIKQKDVIPPHIHDLPKLAELTGLTVNERQKEWLIEITRYHIQARYDDIKYELYKTATITYTKMWLARIEELFLWLNNHF